MNKTKHHNTLM